MNPDYWNRRWKRTTPTSPPIEYIKLVSQRVDRVVDLPKRVLDYGCGIGRWVDFWTQLDFEYEGLDVSKEAINQARLAHPAAKFTLLPNAPDPFDLLFTCKVLIHTELGEVAKLAQNSSTLILIEASWPGPPEFPQAHMRYHNDNAYRKAFPKFDLSIEHFSETYSNECLILGRKCR